MHVGGRASAQECEKKAIRSIFASFFLWMLSRRSMHGYEIIRTLKEDGGFPGAAASRIYPMLAELEKGGLVSQKMKLQGKRARKVYHVTAKGTRLLEKAKKHISESPLRKEYLMHIIGHRR